MPAKLTPDEISLFCNLLGMAPRELVTARQQITERYDLGRRGAWILGLIAKGLDSPSGLTDAIRIGRNLMTAELAALVKAGLITSEKDPVDKRRVRLELTPDGHAAVETLDLDLQALVLSRLDAFDRKDILRCFDILRHFVGGRSSFLERRD